MNSVVKNNESLSEISANVPDQKQKTIVRNGQSILDIAIQESGDIDQYLAIASDNNIASLDDDILGIELLHISKSNPIVVNALRKRNKPSTAGSYEGNAYGEYEQTEYTNKEYNV